MVMEAVIKAQTKEQLVNFVQSKFISEFKNKPDLIKLAPGRINIIGEHTDYNNGLAMPAAIDRWVCVALSKSNEKYSTIYSLNYGGDITVSHNISPSSKEKWMQLAETAIQILKAEFGIHEDVNMAIGGNIPIGCGLSSSAAYVISIAYAFCSLFSINIRGRELAVLCQKIEKNALGITCGLLDQYGIILSKINHCMVIDFQDDGIEYLPTSLHGCSWVVVNSCIQRELSESAYIQRVNECKMGLEILKEIFTIVCVRDINQSMLKELQSEHIELYKRLRHVIEENDRVKKMKILLERGDVSQVGEILQQSHESLRFLYQVSCEEIDFIIELSQSFDGWYGGRIIGGGFGGCSLHLLINNIVDNYKDYISEHYTRRYNLIPEIIKVAFVEGVNSS